MHKIVSTPLTAKVKSVSLFIVFQLTVACSGGGSSSPPSSSPPPPSTPPTSTVSLVSCSTMSADIVAPAAHHAADINSASAIAPSSVGVRAVKSGAWSNAATWGGTVPNGGSVVIPANIGVIVDQRLTPAFKSVRIEGCLEFARNVDTRLRSDFVFVAPGGEIWVGSPSAPIAADKTAEISFPPAGPIDVAKDPMLLGKGFISTSKTTIYGAEKTSKLRTATAPLTGATTIALESAPKGWRVGDKVVLTGTRWVRFKPDANGINRSEGAEDEELTITAINGSSVTISPALKFDHDGPRAEFMPYLANFTRNIKFYTENAAGPRHERAHTMYMSPQTVIRSAEFKDLGRTDKSVRAVDAAGLAQPLPDSNVKGRYPLHLHKAGGHGTAIGTEVRNVAVWGSPGWGITQHQGISLVYDNAVYNAFGSAFTAESGNEQGAWVSNIAIKSEGVAEIVKDAASVIAFDLGRTGDGFWFQGRLLHIHDNVAAGMGAGNGFVFMNRNSDIQTPDPITPDMALQPMSFRYINAPIVEPNIQQFTDNEAFASRRGYHVTKSSPDQLHDSSSVIDAFKAWEVETGVELSYVSGYTVLGANISGARQRQSATGVEFAQNTYDVSVVNSRIDDFNNGVEFSHDWTTTFGPAAFYTSAGNTITNSALNDHFNQDANDVILASAPPAAPPNVSFSWGTSLPTWPSPGTNSLIISGVKTDAVRSVPFPMVANKYKLTKEGLDSLLTQFGYYTLADGRHVAFAPEHYSNRLTGEIELLAYPFEISPSVSLTEFVNNGLVDLNSPPPAPKNDSAIVQRNAMIAIPVRANDGAGGPFDVVGMTPARYGFARINANGDIDYAPYPEFSGSDSFSYWVRAANGKIGKAKVTVTVQ